MTAIFRRELRSYFTTPLGYVFCAVYLAASGFLFAVFTLRSGTSDVSSFSRMMIFGFVVLLPVLTMRTFSEEKRLRTDQLLLTSPVSVTGIVLGKFLSALTVFAGSLLLSCLYVIPLGRYAAEHSPVNGARTFGCFFAMFLIGMCFIAVGIFVSTLTESPVAAAIGTMAILILFSTVSLFNGMIDSYAVRTVLSWFSVYARFANFAYGIFDFSALVYYLSFTAVFLFLAVRVTDRRRWS
ncbi:MAG: ABC transporter permease [Clostridia bacterium]|nr:ABC transporter permease [Clostridia bacterium]